MKTKTAIVITTLCAALSAAAATWHVDSEGGDDAADGLGPATAWRTLMRVNKAKIAPGDKVHDNNLLRNAGATTVLRWLEGKSLRKLDWDGYRALGFDPHSVCAEPKFVNASTRDYRLAAGSPGSALASDGGAVGARDMPGLDGDQSLPRR